MIRCRFTWAVEMTCNSELPLPLLLSTPFCCPFFAILELPLPPSQLRIIFISFPSHLTATPNRLRTPPFETGFGQEPDFARVDRAAAVGLDRAADRGRVVRFFGAEMGEAEAVHAALLRPGGFVPPGACLGGGDCGGVCAG